MTHWRFLVSSRAPSSTASLPLFSYPRYHAGPSLYTNAAVISSTEGDEQLCVTPFFASLFPTCFFPGGSCAAKPHFLHSSKYPRTAGELTVAPNNGSVVGAVKGAIQLPPLRPWHAIANIKSAALYVSNGEDRSGCRGVADEGPQGLSYGSLFPYQDRCYDGEFVDGQIPREETGDANPGAERLSLSTLNARLARYSIRSAPVANPVDDAFYSGNGVDDVVGHVAVVGAPQKVPLTLEWVLQSSAFAFHHTFEVLVRDRQERLAVELTRRWWHHNPHLFPIELPLQEGDSVGKVLRGAQMNGGVRGERGRRVIAKILAQVPAKKYMISSALFCRVLMVALKLGDAALEEGFVLQELLYDGVYGAVCGGCLKGSSDNCGTVGLRYCDVNLRCASSHGSDVCVDDIRPQRSAAGTRFHLFKEKYEDWLVLVGGIAAAAILERHASKFIREQNRGVAYERLVATVRDEYSKFIVSACHPEQDGQCCLRHSSADAMEAPPILPGWAKLLFTTVLRCYEDSGVFHVSPNRRPGNSVLLWRNIQTQLIEKFPHVFHAGSTVATLLALGVLEEASVSTMGTHRLSFVGKEEALRRWRLECLSCQGPLNTCKGVSDGWKNDVDNEENAEEPVHPFAEDVPRTYKQVRARFVASHSSFLSSGYREPIASDSCAKGNDKWQLHWKHRELFGTGACLAFSRLSIPVFITAEDVHRYERDAVDEVSDAWRCAVEIFRDHSSLPLLQLDPDCSTFLSSGNLHGCDYDTALEVSKPSMFVFVRLMSLLASIGSPPRVTNQGKGGDLRFPLVECIEKDVIPLCHPSVAAHLRRCCVTHLSRSGTRGVQLLLAQHQLLLSQKLNEAVATERLLTGLLWSGGRGSYEDERRCDYFSFGSGSFAWQLIAKLRRSLSCSSGSFTLDLILSHLVTLSLAIPDDHRCAVFVSPSMIAVANSTTRKNVATLSSLRGELSWNPVPAQHLYVSLLQLLVWVVEQQGTKGVGGSQDVAETLNGDSGVDSGGDGGLPSLLETARHWCVVHRFFCSHALLFSSHVPFTPSALERVMLILLHTCPDLELLLGSLFALLTHQQGQLLNKRSDTFLKGRVDETKVAHRGDINSPLTPRLLSSLCGMLLKNGVKGRDVLQWRYQRDAPNCSNEGQGASVLLDWHLAYFDSTVRSTCIPHQDQGKFGNGSSEEVIPPEKAATEAKHLLGSLVLGIVAGDSRWKSLCVDNYNVALFLDRSMDEKRVLQEGDSVVAVAKGAFPVGVLLPSLQMTTLHPAGVRQRVTRVKDALREMQPEQRLRVRHSLSPKRLTMVRGVLTEFTLSGSVVEDEEDAVRLFTDLGGVKCRGVVCHRK